MATVNNVTKHLKNGKVVFVFLDKGKYRKNVAKMHELLARKGSAVVLSYDSTCAEWLVKNIQDNDWRIISPLQKGVLLDSEYNRCIVLDSPGNLTRTGLLVKSVLKNSKRATVWVDAFTALKKYADEDDIIRFMHDLVLNSRVEKRRMMITLPMSFKSSRMAVNTSLFADKVFEV